MGSLHNAGFGGVYYYLSRDEPALYPTFYDLPRWEDLPLRLGEPEVPYATEYAPAIFGMISTADAYDYMEANGADMSQSQPGRLERGVRRAVTAPSRSSSRWPTTTIHRVNDQTVTDDQSP